MNFKLIHVVQLLVLTQHHFHLVLPELELSDDRLSVSDKSLILSQAKERHQSIKIKVDIHEVPFLALALDLSKWAKWAEKAWNLNCNLGRDRLSFLHGVSSHDHSTLLALMSDCLPHGAARSRVNTCGSFIDQDYLRATNHRHCQTKLAHVSSTQLACLSISKSAEAKATDRRVNICNQTAVRNAN